MKHDITDKQIKKFLKRELPQAPVNPWFTRKVMNRLPEKRINWAARIENTGFLVAAITLGIFWYMLITTTTNSNVITVGDIFNYVVMIAMTIALSAGYMFSILRKI
ncbi:MAG: hypothetical protein IJN66_07825 [Muribaculaceae bacterium]|nr:hypothetical protein [Muribaculaceae bacterium]